MEQKELHGGSYHWWPPSGGHVANDFPVTVKAQGELKRSALQGKINGGGPLVWLRTSGGNIHIEKM
jgi:hypothetical protein